MKKSLFLLAPFIYLNILNVKAQDTNARVIVDSTEFSTSAPRYDCKGKKDGQINFAYENGNIKLSGACEQGKQVGTWITYFENGRIANMVSFKNGMPNGYVEAFYKNGQLKSKISIKEGEQHGVRTEYFENGQMRLTQTFKNGIMDGEDKAWYDNDPS